MSIVRRRSVSQHDAFEDALQIAPLNDYAKSPVLALKRTPLPLVVGTAAVILVIVSTYLFFKAGSAPPPAAINDRSKAPESALASESGHANGGPVVTVNWNDLEPAYKSYKIQVGNDNSLQANQQTIELYGISILPRNQICSYRSGERWACGQRAYIALLNVLGAGTEDCRPQKTDQPRIVICRIAGSDIAELMLREGWGSLPHGVTEQRYIDAAAAASTTKAGMWSLQPPGR